MGKNRYILLLLCTSVFMSAGQLRAGNGQFSIQTSAKGISGSSAIGNFNPILGGGVVADFNNDGWQDLFITTGGNGPDKLFINHQGLFTDEAASWGLTEVHLSAAAAAADFNGDGLTDLFVTSMGTPGQPATGQHKLYKNTGGAFVDMAPQAGVHTTSAVQADGWSPSWGDYDLDGDLDLVVAGFLEASDGDKLFRNNGDETFTDVTVTAGLSSLSGTHGYAPRFVDMNNDRYPELIWIGDFSTSRYFINNTDGTFTDATVSSGTSLDNSEMGITIGDYDQNGWFDFYVTTIGTNNFYLNQGNHQFSNIAAINGTENSGWGWGVTSLDFNHDGGLDMVTTVQEDRLHAYLNQLTGPIPEFLEVGMVIGLHTVVNGRGVARLDFDNDGDQDMMVFPGGQPFTLFQNDLTGSDIHWLRVFLNTDEVSGQAPHGVGAVVRITIGQDQQFRTITAGNNYMSQDEMSAHFGLGEQTMIDELRVSWPGGSFTTLQQVAADQTLTIHLPRLIFANSFD